MSSDPTTLRVALRYALAAAAARTVSASMGAFFKAGDFCLYGKYKNAHGKILGFGSDAKGNPTVDVEPVPKGRKQVKTMQLFRIWHDPPPALRNPPTGAPSTHVAADPDDSNDEHDFDDD